MARPISAHKLIDLGHDGKSCDCPEHVAITMQSVGAPRGPIGNAVETRIARGWSTSAIMADLGLTYEQVRLVKLRMDACIL